MWDVTRAEALRRTVAPRVLYDADAVIDGYLYDQRLRELRSGGSLITSGSKVVVPQGDDMAKMMYGTALGLDV
jgi:hypothetical protein